METDWREQHGKVMHDFLIYMNEKTDKYILKGGTSLMTCYNLDRFSEDIDLDSLDRNKIGLIVDSFCKANGYDYRIAKDTPTVKRFMIHYNQNEFQKPLKIEISFRKRDIDLSTVSKINGVTVYNINTIALMKCAAYMSRDKIRDLYDVTFICKHYFDKLDTSTIQLIRESFYEKGFEYFDMIIKTQSDNLINKDKLADDFLEAFDILGLIDDNRYNRQVENQTEDLNEPKTKQKKKRYDMVDDD